MLARGDRAGRCERGGGRARAHRRTHETSRKPRAHRGARGAAVRDRRRHPAHAYERRAILIGAGDHGVAEDGVSAYPSEVTAQMVGGFLGGTAAINAFARAVRADVYVANFGVRTPLAPHPRLLDVHSGYATANLARRPAIPRHDLGYVLAAGIAAFDDDRGARAVRRDRARRDGHREHDVSGSDRRRRLPARPPKPRSGRGTGVDDERLARKIAVVKRALGRIEDASASQSGADVSVPQPAVEVWERIASEVGGYEIVGLAGVILAAARARMPVVLDGYIVAAAALIARRDRAARARLLHRGAPLARTRPRARAQCARIAPAARSRPRARRGERCGAGASAHRSGGAHGARDAHVRRSGRSDEGATRAERAAHRRSRTSRCCRSVPPKRPVPTRSRGCRSSAPSSARSPGAPRTVVAIGRAARARRRDRRSE